MAHLPKGPEEVYALRRKKRVLFPVSPFLSRITPEKKKNCNGIDGFYYYYNHEFK